MKCGLSGIGPSEAPEIEGFLKGIDRLEIKRRGRIANTD